MTSFQLAGEATEYWRPSAGIAAAKARARLNALIRDFFAELDVLEVTTPCQGRFKNPDPMLMSSGDATSGWLRTSPEHAHKRLLANHFGALYELGPCFRAGEAGRRHNPEFVMLEWYRPGFSIDELIEETLVLLQRSFTEWEAEAAVVRVTFGAAFLDATGLCPFASSLASLSNKVVEVGGPQGLDRAAAIEFLFDRLVSESWDPNQLYVVTEFPALRPALAEVRDDVACRFEVFAGPLELANGYQELCDVEELKRRWREDGVEGDPYLHDAMAAGLPACAGVALGVDRWLMALQRAESIDEVMLFPGARA